MVIYISCCCEPSGHGEDQSASFGADKARLDFPGVEEMLSFSASHSLR